MVTRRTQRNLRAFTLIELLVVIAIIAILAAILFPVFAVVREQARQSNTMTSLHDVYVGSKLYNDDEGHFPDTLFPLAETLVNPVPGSPPYNRPMLATNDLPAVQFNAATGYYTTTTINAPQRGVVFPEQIKDAIIFANSDNIGRTQTAVTIVYWPLNSPISIALGGTATNPIPVTWQAPTFTGSCPAGGDRDIPCPQPDAPCTNNAPYAGATKVFYFMDSMDIGPMLNTDGTIVMYPTNPPTPKYELHYSPDWTRLYGVGCDVPPGGGSPNVAQLKYANPPSDRTIITYVTQHVATAGSSKVLALTLNGNVRKVDVKIAGREFPLSYSP
jgi:prepilin-type N-terminal cleavage/methylation domain-containing protein